MKYEIRFKPKGVKLKIIRGEIIKEYDDFYLVQTDNYKTCVNKSCIILNETKIDKINSKRK